MVTDLDAKKSHFDEFDEVESSDEDRKYSGNRDSRIK